MNQNNIYKYLSQADIQLNMQNIKIGLLIKENLEPVEIKKLKNSKINLNFSISLDALIDFVKTKNIKIFLKNYQQSNYFSLNHIRVEKNR